MKYLLDDIHWMVAMFNTELQHWGGTIFQWAHSHAGTKGNEYVDQLANEGADMVDRGRYNYPVWKYYSKKAVNAESRQYWEKQMRKAFNEWVSIKLQ